MNRRLLGTAVALSVASATWAQGISATVNGEPVTFRGQGPVQAPDNTILVPLRGIFEQLGAQVQFLPKTKTISATRGATNVTLQVGASVGLINGVEKPLTVPAQNIGGAVLVPLRFIAEAFGATVKFDPAAKLITVFLAGAKPIVKPSGGDVTPIKVNAVKPKNSSDLTVPLTVTTVKPVELPPVPTYKTEPVSGTLVSVGSGSVTVLPAVGEAQVLSLASDVIVLLKVGEAAQTRVELAALRPGDLVTVRRGAQGLGTVVEAAYEERIGVVKSIDALASGKANIVTFVEGPASEVPNDAVVTRLTAPSTLAEIKAGDKVSLRVNPSTKRAVAVSVLENVPPPPPKVEIAKVVHNTGRKWVKAGETVTFTVTGTPGAKGSVRVPGLSGAEALPLVETAAGVYTAAVTVPAGLYLKDASALATLVIETSSSPTVATNESFSIDAVGPILGTFVPAEGAEVADQRPNFTGSYTDSGSGVDARKSQLFVDGQDVSVQAVITDAFFTYRPTADLMPGRHTAVLVIRDTAGNETRREWAFLVQSVVLIKSILVLPNDKPLDFGDVLTLKVEGAAGGKVTYSIGDKIKGQVLGEDSPGSYIGTYAVRKQDAMMSAPVVVTIQLPNGKTATMTADKPITLTAGTPDTPIIDLPQDGASVGNSVVLSGRTLPNATVKVSVKYAGKRAGILSSSGAIIDVVVKANAQGKWATEPIALKTPKELTGVVFTAEVTSVGTSGGTSLAATVKFKR